jgi:hypothetical protein
MAMKITIPKILAGGVGLFTLMFVFALTRVETPETRQTRAMHEVKEAIAEVIDVAFEVPDEVKVWALKRGYQLNGSSVGPTIDLTAEKPDSIIVKTVVVKPGEPNEIDKQADAEPVRQIQAQAPVETNTCTRHGMRKVTTQDGKSWHCRRR